MEIPPGLVEDGLQCHFANPQVSPAGIAEICNLIATILVRNGNNVPKIAEECTDRYFIKYGREVNFAEGGNTLFVAKFTAVAVPVVYIMQQDVARGCQYIVMENVGGENMAELWAALPRQEKARFATAMEGYWGQLRDLQGHYYGGVGPKPFSTAMFNNYRPDIVNELRGPYVSVRQMLISWEEMIASKGISLGQQRIKFWETLSELTNNDDRPMFSHGELLPVNVKRRANGQFVVVNWSHAGWLPKWWDLAAALAANDVHDHLKMQGWDEIIKDIFDNYGHREVFLYQTIASHTDEAAKVPRD